jgi:hypothetical protein
VYQIVLTRVDDFEVSVFNRMFGRENGKIKENRTGFGLLGPKIVNRMLTELMHNKNIQPTHNSARLFAHAFGIFAQTPRFVAVG